MLYGEGRSFHSACESIASSPSVYDLPHPLEYYGADDGKRCMEWEEFDSDAGIDRESDSQISRSNSMYSQVSSTTVVAREFQELMALRKKVSIWLMLVKKETPPMETDATDELESWILRVSKVVSLKRRNDFLSILFPWRKPSRERLKHLISESIMLLKTTSAPSILHNISSDVAVEFPYEELADATDNFRDGNIILKDGYYQAYDAQLRGQRVTVKKFKEHLRMTKIFLTELQVLTHVNHPNVVRLIGYCMEEHSLFLVYEYMGNQDLHQHLLNKQSATLTWDNRAQIALDIALALEYIHEATPRGYIHRDIRPGTILLDGCLRAKIADFEWTIVRGEPDSFRFLNGEVSRKVDVYAFGVLLYQLISAKKPITETHERLTRMFDDVMRDPYGRREEQLRKLVDPRLELDYLIHVVKQMAELARACTQWDPEHRPTMGDAAAALRRIQSENL